MEEKKEDWQIEVEKRIEKYFKRMNLEVQRLAKDVLKIVFAKDKEEGKDETNRN